MLKGSFQGMVTHSLHSLIDISDNLLNGKILRLGLTARTKMNGKQGIPPKKSFMHFSFLKIKR